MATKNIGQLDLAPTTLQDSDKIIVSRDGLELEVTDVGTIKNYILQSLLASSAQIANNAIISAKILDGAVTTNKLQNDAVTYPKLQNANPGVVLGRLSGSGVGDVQELPINVASNGDVTLSTNLSVPVVRTNSLQNLAGQSLAGCVQIVSKLITGQGSQVVPANSGDVLVGTGFDPFEVIFTPKLSGSFVKITVRWAGEVANSWDMVFNVTRNASRLNNPSSLNTQGLAVATQSYFDGAAGGPNNSSTPEYLNLVTVDTTGTFAWTPITYRLVASGFVAATIRTNRCFDSAETFTSEIIIEEYAQ